jgi:hypothetical protein
MLCLPEITSSVFADCCCGNEEWLVKLKKLKDKIIVNAHFTNLLL